MTEQPYLWTSNSRFQPSRVRQNQKHRLLRGGLRLEQAAREPAASQGTARCPKRNRRSPTDPVNAMLSLAYSMLAKDRTLAALAVEFDPYLGFYHQPRFGRPALGLDLMEEFGPLIAESTVLSCINNRVITALGLPYTKLDAPCYVV